MKYYLSSYKLGNELTKLQQLIKQTSGKFAYVPNALDFTTADPVRVQENVESNMADLRAQGAEVELVDLKNYFNRPAELKAKLLSLGGIYIQGGNTFVLRQAMKLSGLDTILLEMQSRNDFLYVGYSAGVCVLGPDLRVHSLTDDAKNFPYPEITAQLWDGLGILPFTFEPHYDSNHSESLSTDKEIEYCVKNKILFKAYRDGEVLIIE